MKRKTRDTLFAHPRQEPSPFEFNEQVVEVFDDMLERSVPLYRQALFRQAQLTRYFYRTGTLIYDLGCSNGNFGLTLLKEMGARPFTMVAIDSSAPMLETFRERLRKEDAEGLIDLVHGDITDVTFDKPASVVVINLTLQFLPLSERTRLLQKVYEALVPGGVLLLSEKVVHTDPGLDRLQQEFYYRFKAECGYSQLEISQKREALENVLIPEPLEAHLNRLKDCGFPAVDVWLKWFNFASLVVRKGS